VIGKG